MNVLAKSNFDLFYSFILYTHVLKRNKKKCTLIFSSVLPLMMYHNCCTYDSITVRVTLDAPLGAGNMLDIQFWTGSVLDSCFCAGNMIAYVKDAWHYSKLCSFVDAAAPPYALCSSSLLPRRALITADQVTTRHSSTQRWPSYQDFPLPPPPPPTFLSSFFHTFYRSLRSLLPSLPS